MPTSVLITGATSGIGRALALEYSKSVEQLYLCARREEMLQEVAEQCRANGANVECKKLDVTDKTAMRNWLLACDDHYPIDLLIANAGIGGLESLAGRKGESEDAVHRIMQINTMGVFNTIEPIKPRMVDRKMGQIAIVSSMASYMGLPDSPAYCASKAATRIYGDGLRPVLARHNVKVNVICPGFVKSDMSDQLPFPLPFLQSMDKSVSKIMKGLEKNKARISFPFPLLFASWFGMILPASVTGVAMGKFRSYPGKRRAGGRK